MVNQAFAGRYFKNRNPIGGRFGKDGPEHSTDYEIVGVVEDAKYQSGYKPAAADVLPTARAVRKDAERDDGSLERHWQYRACALARIPKIWNR